MDCSPPGFSVHGILQARILEWVAISSSGGSSWPRDRTHVSSIARWILYHWATRWWFQSWSVRAHLQQKRLGNTEGCSPQPLQRPAAAVLQGPLPVEAQGQAALFPPSLQALQRCRLRPVSLLTGYLAIFSSPGKDRIEEFISGERR